MKFRSLVLPGILGFGLLTNSLHASKDDNVKEMGLLKGTKISTIQEDVITEDVVRNSSTVESMTLLPRESIGGGNYYLAPTIAFAKLGPSSFGTEEIFVDENGENHYGIENVFLTEFKTFGLNVDYSTENARDNYAQMGHWRHNYSSRFDFDINPEYIKDKSNFYGTPRDACESGFDDIKDTMYRGVLSTLTSVYNKKSDSCALRKNGKNIGEFIVWNRSKKRDDIHYVSMPKGEFIIFKKNKNNRFVAKQDGLTITLNKERNGNFNFKDSKDFTWRYNKKGELSSLTKEGEKTSFKYDRKGKLVYVKGIKNNILDFKYNRDDLIEKISWRGVGVKAKFEYSDNKMLSSYKLIAEDEDFIEKQVSLINFEYNDKNLLINATSPKIVIKGDQSIEKQSSKYSYDELNRVNIVNSNNLLEKYIYEENKFTKILPNGHNVEAEIALVGIKQVLKSLKDNTIVSKYKFNKNGKLSKLVLVESKAVKQNATGGSSDIQTSIVNTKSKLTLNINYNKRGLISSQTYKTSDGVKKMSSFEYKTRYNKPTRVLTKEDVSFFDFNKKGQLTKMSYLKFNKNVQLGSYALLDIRGEDGFEETSYRYDRNGLLVKTIDEVNNKEIDLMTLQNGEKSTEKRSESRWRWRNPILGLIKGRIYDITDGHTQFSVVSGAGGYSMKGLYTRNRNGRKSTNHFYWEQIDYKYRYSPDIFKKRTKRHLIVAGHSYGGDSAFEGAIRNPHKVDILMTLDPVGHAGYRLYQARGVTKYWINVYVNPGRQKPGIKWKKKCKRKWGVKYCYWKSTYLPSQWNKSDWVAWTGGKGSYSSYGKYVPADDVINMRAHHGETSKMIREIQKTRATNFKITP